MVLYLAALLAIMLFSAKYHSKAFNREYLSVEHTQNIKGIFVFLVIATHFVRYNSFSGIYHDLYFRFRSYMDQLIVVPFLFYSGYGIAQAIQKKGKPYLRAFPRTRILSTYLQFFVVVLLYLLFRYSLGNRYSYKQIILAFTGYQSLGNGSWYVFTILFLYGLTWLSFSLFFKHESAALCAVTVGTAAYILGMRQLVNPYFYNTAMCYAAGCWFSRYKAHYERFVLRSRTRYYIVCILCIILFFLSHHFCQQSLALYEANSVLLALLLVLLSSTIQLRSPFLQYCGKHVFSLYILHHIPMILLQFTPLSKYWFVHLLSSLILAFLMSWLFDRYIARYIHRFCKSSNKPA